MESSEELATQQIEYTRTIVPPTMRSPYWKFFGFPSDSSNNVLTKQKIVCSLCYAVIAYNKNTSNLRTHIVARHPELLIELYNEKKKRDERPTIANIVSAERVLPTTEPVAKRLKTLYVINSHENNTAPTSETRTNNQKPLSNTIVSVNEVIEHSDEKATDNSDYSDYSSLAQNTEYAFEELDESIKISALPIDNHLEKQLLDMIILDLLPPSTVENPGFSKFADSLGIPDSLLRKSHIEEHINKLYQKSFQKIHQELKTITNTMAYSLGIEYHQNIENKSLMTIYFNYLDLKESRLQFTAYTTIEITPSVDYSNIFREFNLSNCSAAVVIGENDSFEQFLAANGIPVIPCFEAVINNCMNTIFGSETVNNIFEKTLDLFEKNDFASMLDSVPDLYEENAWSKYNFLQFVQDHVTLADDDYHETIEMSKQLVGFLGPLKITLETIADEPLALSSLMKPLSKKLTEEYFSNYFTEADVLLDVKNIVTNELEQRVISNIFLSEASFLDPRFQNVIVEGEDLQSLKRSIEQRFEHLLANNEEEKKPIKLESSSLQRKSSLKLFFNRGSDQEAKPRTTKRSLEYEIMKYTAEANVDLEQCPVTWWADNELSFKKLRKISEYYTCVPCCATNLFKYSLKERTNITHRRFMLRKGNANQLWFLHYNKDLIAKYKIYELIKK